MKLELNFKRKEENRSGKKEEAEQMWRKNKDLKSQYATHWMSAAVKPPRKDGTISRASKEG